MKKNLRYTPEFEKLITELYSKISHKVQFVGSTNTFTSISWNPNIEAQPTYFKEFNILLEIFKLQDISYLKYNKFFDNCVQSRHGYSDCNEETNGLLFYFTLEDFILTLLKEEIYPDLVYIQDYIDNFL